MKRLAAILGVYGVVGVVALGGNVPVDSTFVMALVVVVGMGMTGLLDG